jgi:hypothetical protein
MGVAVFHVKSYVSAVIDLVLLHIPYVVHNIKSPKAIAYKVVGLLSQRKKMLRPKEVLKMERILSRSCRRG